MENYIALAIIAVIVSLAVLYVYRAKKKGTKCMFHIVENQIKSVIRMNV